MALLQPWSPVPVVSAARLLRLDDVLYVSTLSYSLKFPEGSLEVPSMYLRFLPGYIRGQRDKREKKMITPKEKKKKRGKRRRTYLKNGSISLMDRAR